MVTEPPTSISNQPSRRLWFAAIKPPIYTVAVTPVIVLAAAAYGELGIFDGLKFILFLAAAIFLIAWMNLSNDVFDAATGVDINKESSMVTLTGDRRLVFLIALGFLGLGLSGISGIAFLQKDWTVLALLSVATAIAYTYQGPPFRLGYFGIGEPICCLAYFLTGLGVFYSQAQTLTGNAAWASVWVAMSTSIILFCSHFHQVEDDQAAGKVSPIVRLGTYRGAQVLTYSLASLLGLTCLLITTGIWSPWMLLTLASAPFALDLINTVRRYHDQPDNIRHCKFIAVKFHFTSGLLLAIAYGLSYYDVSFLSVTGLTY